jgi:tetratricopeptide (TPR) repeat protein
MGFIKHDYIEARRRRNNTIAILTVVAIIVVVISYNLFKKSPQEGPSLAGTQVTAHEGNSGPKPPEGAKKTKDLPTIIRETRNSVVMVRTFDRKGDALGVGSGFIVTAGGELISNYHVFRGSHHAEVETAQGKFRVDKVLDSDSRNDLVRLSLGKTGHRFTPLKMSDSTPQVGESIMVIGNPMGLETTVSNGIISAQRKFPPFGRVIQITCPISPGSSGSPVLNMQGDVIGVATFQMSEGQNLNFAIPITYARALKTTEGKDLASVNFENSELIQSQEEPFEKGVILYSRQQYEEAIPFFKKAVEKNPQHAEAYYHLGLCYKELKTTDAVEAFKKAIQLKEDYVEAYFHLGVTYTRLNMQEEAINSFREALRINPDYDEALMNLGIAYGIAKKYSAAVAALEKSVAIFPEAKAYYYLGAGYSGLNKHDKAIYAFKQCVEMEPDNLDALIGLGISYGSVESWHMGIKTLNKAVLLDPGNGEVHLVLGVLHLGNHDLESAELEYQVLETQKNSSKYKYELSRAISEYKFKNRGRY